MKTSNFEKRIKELGYTMVDDAGEMMVYRDDKIVATVHGIRVNSLDNIWGEDVSNELFDVLVEYARTPIKERKDSKKYYLYNPVRDAYFNYHVKENIYGWDGSSQTTNIQTQFTEEEIKNHIRFRDIMELLVKEEV